MAKSLGIISFPRSSVWVQGMEDYRPIAAFTVLGRYRMIDFPISNLSNSGIETMQVYVRRAPRSIVEHIGIGRHYNINPKSGYVKLLFSDMDNPIYNTDIYAYLDNLEQIENSPCEYVVIAPHYMIFTQDYNAMLENHIESGADISILCQNVDNAKDHFLAANMLTLNKQQGVIAMEQNAGTAKNRVLSLDSYIMKKEIFIDLIKAAHNISSMYTLAQIIGSSLGELDVRAYKHKGFVACITDFKSYYDANMDLLNFNIAKDLFNDSWPIYTKTNNSCPTHYLPGADVKGAFVSNGSTIAGSVENSVIGRGCTIEPGAVIKNSIISAGVTVSAGTHVENFVVDKYTKITKTKELIASQDAPGYVKRRDVI